MSTDIRAEDDTAPGRILVVDDDRAVRESLVRALELEGYAVTAVGNGAEALDVVAADDLPWQVAVLVVATLTLVTVLVAARGNLAYAAAGGWALVGIAVTGSTEGTTAVLSVALAALAVLVVVALGLRLRGARAATSA